MISSSPLALASSLSQETRAELASHISDSEPRMTEVAHSIWSSPELGYLKTNTVDALAGELEQIGLAIERGVGNIPTAFVPTPGSEGSPVIALLAEMDALPGFSQDAVPTKQAVDGIERPCLRASLLRRGIRGCGNRDL